MDNVLVELLRNAMMLAAQLSAPVLLTVLGVGLLIGIFQAMTQISDPTVSLVPRVLAATAVLTFSAGWLGQHVMRFAQTAFESIAR